MDDFVSGLLDARQHVRVGRYVGDYLADVSRELAKTYDASEWIDSVDEAKWRDDQPRGCDESLDTLAACRVAARTA